MKTFKLTGQFLIAVFFLLLSTKGIASHLSGADIRYEYTGQGNVYRVYFTAIKQCDPSAISLSSTVSLSFSSSSTATYFYRSLPTISIDTVEEFCTGAYPPCSASGSIGFIRRVYSDTVSLLPCNDWKIYFEICCRNIGIANLQSPNSYSTYVEAFLNNSASPNSSTYLPSPPRLFVQTNSYYTIPLQALDPNSDSIVYEWYHPAASSTTPIPYAGGFSFSNPINGTLSLDPIHQILNVQSNQSGKFTLALRVKDYRNGILVGYSVRDFVLYSAPSVLPNSFPIITNPAVLNYATCPGQSNSISLSFSDSTSTDSIFASALTPVVPGFTFNTTSTPGLGTGSVSINWTTPSTFNPADLPYFFINVPVKDNSCPLHAISYYAILVHTSQCNTDSVWAGDANADYTVSFYDALPIAVAYNKTGFMRPNASINWQAEYCADWTDTFANGVNIKHADCNGDGHIDTSDLAAITANWGNVHVKPGGIKPKTTGVPDLYFDISGINFFPGSSVSIPISLGDGINTMNNIYGLASKITVGGISLVSPPVIGYSSSWIGNSTNTLQFIKYVDTNQVAWAYARKDHQNVSGNGAIANLDFTIPSNALPGTAISLSFDNSSRIVNSVLADITNYNEKDTFGIVLSLDVKQLNTRINSAMIVPNPSKNNSNLQLNLSQSVELNISITDIAGRIVSIQDRSCSKGENSISLPSTGLMAGLYIIKINDPSGNLYTLKWVKE
jgi:hypothetical protein